MKKFDSIDIITSYVIYIHCPLGDIMVRSIRLRSPPQGMAKLGHWQHLKLDWKRSVEH